MTLRCTENCAPLILPIDKRTKVLYNVFDRLGNDRSVGEWIFDAVNGDVKTYGLELLDKTF